MAKETTGARDKSLIDDAFNALDSKEHGYKLKWMEYEKIYRSEHDKALLDRAADEDRSALFIPTAYTTVEIANAVFSSSFFGNEFPIEILKIGENDADKAAALTTVCKHYYTKDKPQPRMEKAFLEAQNYGLGIMKVYWCDETMQPVSRMTHITDIAFDPEAEDVDDIGYVVTRFKQTHTVIENLVDDNFYTINKKKLDELLGRGWEENPYKRRTIHEIYHKERGGKWRCRTYIKGNETALRDVIFERLPFHYGYALHRLPSIDDNDRSNEIAVYGESLIRVIRDLVAEINRKRNQKNDLMENTIKNPHFLPDAANVNPKDLNRNGQHIRCSTTNGIIPHSQPSTYDLTQDDAINKRDLEEASAINGVMRGSTSTSDRRSGTSLAMVSSNSSLRLEGMIKLLHATLFESYVRHWVELVYKNAPDDLVAALTEREDYPLGRKGDRDHGNFDFTVNFGLTINKQYLAQSILTVLQTIGPMGANVLPLLKEVVRLMIGENVNVDKLFEDAGIGGDAGVSGDAGIGADKNTGIDGAVPAGSGGMGVDPAGQGGVTGEDVARLVNNQI